jgi:hypothetical protein
MFEPISDANMEYTKDYISTQSTTLLDFEVQNFQTTQFVDFYFTVISLNLIYNFVLVDKFSISESLDS